MTTKDSKDATDNAPSALLEANLAKVEELSSRLIAALSNKRTVPSNLQGPSQDLFQKAAAAYVAEMMSNPSKMMEQQVGFWAKSMKHYMEAQQTLASGKLSAPADPGPKDRRFSNPMWDTHPYFNYLKQQYLFSSEAMSNAVTSLEGLDAADRKRVTYFTQQIMDMFSPTNFLGTNPEALARAVETEGQSLVDGLENLVRDIEANEGELIVSLADKEAFKVGENIGTTEGSVVFRNKMFELIQYAPKTEKVRKIPLLIFPPWINKFYILDLKPKNSLINWIVEQGYTLFVVSWVNPDASYAGIGLGDYIEDGYLTAIEEVKAITQQEQINVIGYCIAGTTLALTLSLLKQRGDTSIKSATFFTTLTDFADQGEVGVFLNDDFIDGLEQEVGRKGILESFYMARTFSYLRANDLIYQPAIRSYMMGEAPPAFDLLYWNGDGTNLPDCMAMEYLRGLCQENKFADGGFDLLDTTLHLQDVQVPVCAIACETDHIAAWGSSYVGIQQMGSRSKTFILSESGHIAGIVNPPSKKKYGHYTNSAWPKDPESWKNDAEFTAGSWWPTWETWLRKRSGAQVQARVPGEGGREILAAAPGTYVIAKPDV
ncbi:class I poly(R)-hydroxyalkanoic acid synthase [Oceaniglobus ichthyenteri]|uniref:class I poly(R)-hydroxyalkanoic acid synthase n=1 Tax=Oceaniglobus ichthyenteri TaxID=2136177 RepID=UPI000D353A6C|nr:class I poly(R)-hydroxyalkanoic acid synthase [Oceaniglobus ichthyenteri]